MAPVSSDSLTCPNRGRIRARSVPTLYRVEEGLSSARDFASQSSAASATVGSRPATWIGARPEPAGTDAATTAPAAGGAAPRARDTARASAASAPAWVLGCP
jgi:hypothetical protein